MLTDSVSADVAQPPVAVVQGAPFNDLPDDLYIPPDALEVFLEAFEGPLDLLLYLIKKENLDILHISIAQITEQYMNYIDMMGVLRMELAAEYLVMAALLAEIKSRMLLPRPPPAEEEEEDPRAELVRRLQEYECIKKAAEDLDRLPRCERDTFAVCPDTGTISVPKHLPEVQLKDILLAFQDVLRRAERLSHHQIVKEPLSVRERMSQILERLHGIDSLPFSHLFVRKEGRHGVVVAFLAILELSKEGLIEILQTEPLAELCVRTVQV
ncbi:MAG: segregation and condensation protein A [Gammaproteobacteria bacterium]